ncbi:DhNV_068 [Dikerogammarus haemobaphes nudivirus]|nr:DhNV_068 [Dikerogammarus haemobaphes nudivirus]
MFQIRKVLPYQSSIPCPKTGCKCIVLDGTRYIIHVKNNEIIAIYDAKYKSKKEDEKPLADKNTPELITKLSHILFTSGCANLPSEYVFEIIHSTKGILVTDILYQEGESLFENDVKYSNRITILNNLIQSLSAKLKCIDREPYHNIDINLVMTPTIIRDLSSVLNFGSDYLISPIEKTFTYAIVGTAHILKPDIIFKREPYTKMGSLNTTMKMLLIGEEAETVLDKFTNVTDEKQLEFYNAQKKAMFENVTEDIIKVRNPQTQKVHLVAGVNKNKLSIFGYTRDGKKQLNEENVFIVDMPETVRWEKESFKSNFIHIKYYKTFFHIVSRPINKFNIDKLSIVSLISSTALSPHNKINTEIFDSIPVVDTNTNIHKTLNTASNTEIIGECITRIGNILLESENTNLKTLFNNLLTFKHHDSKITEKFNELLRALELNEDEVIRTILKPLQNEITDVNHKNLQRINNLVIKLKRKRCFDKQQMASKKIKLDTENIYTSDEE